MNRIEESSLPGITSMPSISRHAEARRIDLAHSVTASILTGTGFSRPGTARSFDRLSSGFNESVSWPGSRSRRTSRWGVYNPARSSCHRHWSTGAPWPVRNVTVSIGTRPSCIIITIKYVTHDVKLSLKKIIA